MDARWERIESICLGALEREPESRAAYLDDACGGDVELRREVDSLLEQIGAASDFLEIPLACVTDLPPDDELGDAEMSRYVGAYRLVRPLGRGGMGEVYLAVHEAEGFQQTVALKVIKRGMDTDEVLRRFRLERQILASLHHPNIALLLDGGATADGQPYFVMEYVDGLPVDEYCGSHALPIQRRLELFQVICSAVQHAHANLVVHRDLKPSNVLVTADGLPKLLDFGIGKVLAPDTSVVTPVDTRTNVRVLTPEYASPEQIRGEPVTTATDVYGLGVLMYELLSGQHPYPDAGSLAEVERLICEEYPRRPSLVAAPPLRRRLSGDLDNIVLKALRKEPERRYSSATALADDIQRHLEGLPVKARPDTLAYRAGKFLRRHRWGVAAAAVVFTALGAASVWTFAQSQRVARERDKALEIQGFLLETYGAGGADQTTGETVTARQLLDGQAATLETAYDDRPELLAAMMAVVAEGYERLGLYHDAEPLARRALSVRREIHGGDHPDVGASANTLGLILYELDQTEEAESLLREAVTIRRAGGRRHRAQLARALNDLAVLRLELGDLDEAEALHREAHALRLAQFGENHRSVGVSASNLSAVLYRKGELGGAVEMAEQALRAIRNTLGPDHQRSAVVQSNLAAFKAASGDEAGSEADYRDLLERQTRVLGREHPTTTQTMLNLAQILHNREKHAESEEVVLEVLAIREATLGDVHRDLAPTLILLARTRAARRDFAGAIEVLQRALAIERTSYADAPRVPEALVPLARMYEVTRDYAAAERLRRELVSTNAEVLGSDHPQTVGQQVRLALVLLRSEQYPEAARVAREAHRTALREFPNHTLTRTSRLYLAHALIGSGELETADSLLRESRILFEAGELIGGQTSMQENLERMLAARQDSLAGR